MAEFLPGVRIPLAPFCGELGVAPPTEGAHSTIPPDVFGGNMDTRHLTAGTKLFLPVFAPGAPLLARRRPRRAGRRRGLRHRHRDADARQRAPDRAQGPARHRAGVPDRRPAGAGTNTGPYYATDGVGPDLMTAARDAVRRMIEYLGRDHGLDPVDAYLLAAWRAT